MKTAQGHLTYCTNIHAGESWGDHFAALKQHLPEIKKAVCPDKSFGVGLRLSNVASIELEKEEKLEEFQGWLQVHDCYVFTMNGFPYGGFHHEVVKDGVHAPDWTTGDRVVYTIRLARILAALLPQGMEGGISTSPLSYRHWHPTDAEKQLAFERATDNLLEVVKSLVQLKEQTGKVIHIDLEPEPDGLLECGAEFLEWYWQYLLPRGGCFLMEQFRCSKTEAERMLREHVQLCYDICHFAIEYENHEAIVQQLQQQGIRIGKIQISAALKAALNGDAQERAAVIDAFRQFNEPVYLHQLVARTKDGALKRYADLPDALKEAGDSSVCEWRAHYHVPLFVEGFGVLKATRADIEEVLGLQQRKPFTAHLEIETYTWEVLPEELKLPLQQSISRELDWVLQTLNRSNH
ncbi:metabolite traffic protein EboE [Flaviaesturariibacter amylovorans]|uniref:Metabolite traffic protein EboE n=1 Tax=Flaviaesturariibacter amylovorans TaxID=1084520 RepID=A0ABP8HLU6_9BACT